jgi:hypothetical protein
MPPLESSPYRLFVEGPDDLHTVIHVLARNGYDWDDESKVRPHVDSLGGVTKLLESLTVILKSSYERVGVVIDANASLSDRWAQLQARAASAGVELPDSPVPEGTIVPGLRLGSRFGVWLMPDNSSPGSLESFLSRLVPAGDPCWTYADEAAIEARRRGARCPEKDHLKSRLHTWLAWQEESGLPFGTALRARVFQHDSEDALRFVSWFRRLFVDPSP